MDTNELIQNGLRHRSDFLHGMNPSRFKSWDWAADNFKEGAEWIQKHPHNIREGVYLSDTPGKEVWLIELPLRLAETKVVIKIYHETTPSWLSLGVRSIAVNEALNYASLAGLGIPIATPLGCGETRHCGKLTSSYIITRFIKDTVDGSTFMPGGSLADQHELRMAFCKKAMEIIARAHVCGFIHTEFHPGKILISKTSTTACQELTLVDIAKGGFKSVMSKRAAIAIDLATFFVDLRLDADEIKMLCNYYLDFNPKCGFDPDSLWEALVSVDFSME